MQAKHGGLHVVEAAVDGQPPRLEPSHLSALLAAEEGGLVRAAERLWDLFAADPATTEAAQRMQVRLNDHACSQHFLIAFCSIPALVSTVKSEFSDVPALLSVGIDGSFEPRMSHISYCEYGTTCHVAVGNDLPCLTSHRYQRCIARTYPLACA